MKVRASKNQLVAAFLLLLTLGVLLVAYGLLSYYNAACSCPSVTQGQPGCHCINIVALAVLEIGFSFLVSCVWISGVIRLKESLVGRARGRARRSAMKQQSALEFLLTYGWAFTIIAVLLLALYATGYFNPSTYSAQQCVLSSGFSCLSFFMTTNGVVTVNVKYSGSAPVNITAVSCNQNQQITNTQAPFHPPSNQIFLQPGANYTFNIQCYSGSTILAPALRSTFGGFVAINYTNDVTRLPDTASGHVAVKVSESPTSSTTYTIASSTTLFSTTLSSSTLSSSTLTTLASTSASSSTSLSTSLSTSVSSTSVSSTSLSTTTIIPFGIDGSSSCSGASAAFCSLSLTTSYANELILLAQSNNGAPSCTTPQSTPSLTWTQRTTEPFGTNGELCEYYAVDSSSGSLSVNAEWTSSTGSLSAIIFTVSSANTISPYDSNAAVPCVAASSGSPTSCTLSTTNPNDMIIGYLGAYGGPAISAGSGFALVPSTCPVGGGGAAVEQCGEYKLVSSAQSNLAVTFTGATANTGIIGDAIKKTS
ncbi:MAG: hypothetical protein KGI04_04725 [Candidatus Micrarchaeota archaeon]|nr:hypothetical protein [Candidatus Micrarchaeota archaeon]